MTSHTHIVFNSRLAKDKPENIINFNSECPFCNRHKLEGILAEKGPILFLKNKYPVLEDTVQTVLVETYECNAELSTYPKHHLYNVLNFGVRTWLEMEKSGDFASVIYYKNHGPYSGGTIRHPHMQIVGLKHINYALNVSENQFCGLVIDRKNDVELNISTQPRIGFFEFNAILDDGLDNIEQFADYIQMTTHYLLNNFNKRCNSYNLFFYHLDRKVIVKIMPRFVTSPLYIGFSIPQVSDRLKEVIQEIRQTYL